MPKLFDVLPDAMGHPSVPRGGGRPRYGVLHAFLPTLAQAWWAVNRERTAYPRHLPRWRGARDPPASALLHGDLHHDNVLRDADRWVAIDPHGWIGEPGFELGPLLYNPDPAIRSAELLALVPARLEQLADALALSPERGQAWGFVAAVLSEVWSTEDVTAYAPGRALDVALQLERAAGRL